MFYVDVLTMWVVMYPSGCVMVDITRRKPSFVFIKYNRNVSSV